MKINRYDLIACGLALIAFIIGAIFYPQMPEQMASHWNAQGVADGYASRFEGVYLLPIISLVLVMLLLLVPKIDPLKANIEKFKRYYYGFVLLFVVFFNYIYLLTLLWNNGSRFDMTQALTPAMGILFYLTGVMISKAKRNYFIGIRTPWTLSNDEVWNKTHQLGGWLFKFSGLITILGVFFADYAILFMLAPVLVSAAVSFIYSYIVYQKVIKA